GRDHHPNAVIGLGGLSVVAEALVDEPQNPGREQSRTHGDRDPRVGEGASQLHPERGTRRSSHHCSCWSVPPVVSVLRLPCTAVAPRFCRVRRGRARGAHLTSRTSPHSAPSTATLAFPTPIPSRSRVGWSTSSSAPRIPAVSTPSTTSTTGFNRGASRPP